MKTDKKVMLILVIGIALILMLSFVMAKNTKPNKENKDNDNNSTNETKQKKMTHGLCVANLTKQKNACFKLTQQNYKACEKDIRNLTHTLKESNQTINKTEIKDMRVKCRTALKTQLKTCKESFKASKVLCGQYKCKENHAFINNTCTRIEN